MTNHLHGDEPARTNSEQSGKVYGPIDRALSCLNGMTSFLAFEKLEGLSSHQSNVFHDLAIHCVFGLISAWKPELSAMQNDENTARLLIDLNAKGLKSIQLLGHLHEEPDVAPARAFYFNYGYPDYEKNKTLLLSLCKKYDQPAIAACESGQIRIFDASGRVEKGFTLSTMKPTHLRKVWSDMVKQKFVWLESGYRDASPVTICGPMYAGAGLRSDLIGGLTDEVRTLCRYRPLQEKPDEASIIAKVQWTAESLAADLFKAKQSADTTTAQKCDEKLNEFCLLHNLDKAGLIEADKQKRASLLAIYLLRTRKTSKPERAQRCYERLENFCIDQCLNLEDVITAAKERLNQYWGPGTW